jgi:hypothetical protein
VDGFGVKSTTSDGARNDPLSSGEDAADDIIRERTARSREGVRGHIVDSVPKGHVCRTSHRGKRVEGFRAMEHGSMGEGKGREEGSVGLDGSEMAVLIVLYIWLKPNSTGHTCVRI